jgi:hypothetical protein
VGTELVRWMLWGQNWSVDGVGTELVRWMVRRQNSSGGWFGDRTGQVDGVQVSV